MAKTRSMKNLSESSRRRQSPRTKTIHKKKKINNNNVVQQKSSSDKITTSGSGGNKNGEIIDFDIHDDGVEGGCSTPKAQRYKLPEIDTCPPAPKKQRSVNPNCSLQRRKPIAFYAPPDLELFFLFCTT